MNDQKRVSYDAKFKLSVIQYAEETTNREAARRFGVDEINVRRWKKMKERLEGAKMTSRAFRGPKQGSHPEVDAAVLRYAQDLGKHGLPITREMIKVKALDVARDLGIPFSLFKASFGWCRNFMRRNGLTLLQRPSVVHRLPEYFHDALLSFQRDVISLRKKHNYLLSQIGNADETAVFFDLPLNTLVNFKGKKSIILNTTGNSSLRVTIMLGVLADGRKLPPFVILKGKLISKEKIPDGIILRCQERGWMTSELMEEWLEIIWNKRPGDLLKDRGMLLLSSFKGHVTPQIRKKIESLNSDLVIIPSGMTSQLQVIDKVNKPFKDYLMKEYSDWLMSDECSVSNEDTVKRPCVAELCAWILKAWNRVIPDLVVQGFKKCCISNNLDGSEDYVLWDNYDDMPESEKPCEQSQDN